MIRRERTLVMGGELRREAVYRDGEYVGEIVYVARRRKAKGHEIATSSTGFVTDHGWRPDGWHYPKNAKLTDSAEAIDRLRSVADAA